MAALLADLCSPPGFILEICPAPSRPPLDHFPVLFPHSSRYLNQHCSHPLVSISNIIPRGACQNDTHITSVKFTHPGTYLTVLQREWKGNTSSVSRAPPKQTPSIHSHHML